MSDPQIFPVTVVIDPFENPTKEHGTDRKAVGIPLAAIPDGYRLETMREHFDAWRTRPERRKGHVVLDNEDSFIKYVNRYKNPETTVIFIKRIWRRYKAICVFNFHPAGPEPNETGFGDFSCGVVVKNPDNILQSTNTHYFYGDAP